VLSEVLAELEAVGFWVAGALIRLDGSLTFDPRESWLCCDATSLRRVCRRSKSDPRDTLVLSETLGEDTWGADLVILSLVIRLPTSDGCGKELRVLFCVFGE